MNRGCMEPAGLIEIQLTKGYKALVDEEDADLAAFKWCAAVMCSSQRAYAARAKRRPDGTKRLQYMHQVIAARFLDVSSAAHIDHADNNPLNNRRSNLRLASSSQNSANRRRSSNNTSGMRGVHWNKNWRGEGTSGKWVAEIEVLGKRVTVGASSNIHHAAALYDCAVLLFWGEFSVTNFPASSYPDIRAEGRHGSR